MKGILLTLDLSTAITGYACFDIESKKLTTFGMLKPEVKGIHKMKYPEAAYYKIKSMSEKVRDLVLEKKPDVIVVEEINRGINRIGQKSLDALHFFVIDYLVAIDPSWAKKIVYLDSNGKKGWRGMLGLKLSAADKEHNKMARTNNKKKTKVKEIPVIDWKVLAERYVNPRYDLKFDVNENAGDNDMCDAVALGDTYLHKILK